MGTDERKGQDRKQADERNVVPPELWHPQAQRPLNDEEGEHRADDARQDPRAVRSGAPGKTIDDAGGPGLGVPPGGSAGR